MQKLPAPSLVIQVICSDEREFSVVSMPNIHSSEYAPHGEPDRST